MYHPASIEPKWQKFWANNSTFAALNPPFSWVAPKKAYILDMFPYPSGAGLHVGHPKGQTATDVYSRFLAANGYNVLHPMGWDAFGLPAENYAVKTGQHPRVTTEENVTVFKRQIQELGMSYDWSREINTTDPEYYRWSQWIFSRLMERGLAYEAEKPVNWCPALKCVLANEEIVNGKSEVGGHPVEQRNMRQWVLRITEYAERLLADIDTVDWPEGIKEQQRHWIGKSEGCEFTLLGEQGSISVYTTRVDTVYGMKWVVIAPDHPQVSSFVTADHQGACDEYIVAARAKSDQDRTNAGLEKTGVFTGSYVVNPFNGESVPVWIADYVLGSYGTGAVMGVPAHDERDFEFAVKYGFEIKNVVFSIDETHKTWSGYANLSLITQASSLGGTWDNVHIYEAFLRNECSFVQYGILRDSWEYSGLTSDDARTRLTELAESKGFGHKRVNYKLRDWIFSRQRYWGEPIPVIHLNKEDFAKLPTYTEWSTESSIEIDAHKRYLRINGERYSEIFTTIDGPCVLDPNLPLVLPEVAKYEPSDDGRSPLANVTEWVNTLVAPGLRGTRETNTMPQWAGSCWYYLRFMDPHNPDAIASQEALEYWGSVDHYVGGAEHAVLHLLYARFWHKVLYDLGVVPTLEPFQKLTNQGLILGPDGNKMSKSKGNVINPDDIVKEFGADVLRTYILSMADFKDPAPWDTKSMVGMQRFLERSEALFGDRPRLSSDEMRSMKLLHKTIKKVGEDIAAFKFNTAISALIILVNEGLPTDHEFQTEWRTAFALLLHPFAPHLGEELWSKLGHTESIYRAPWPEFDTFMTIDDEVTIAIQVNGKLRATKEFLNGVAAEEVISEAYSLPDIAKWTAGKKVIREIFIPNKLLNIVVGE